MSSLFGDRPEHQADYKPQSTQVVRNILGLLLLGAIGIIFMLVVTIMIMNVSQGPL